MCAINGTTEENKDRVVRMNARTIHRGPDGSEVWVGGGITLGHNRLAIIDLETRSLQPMESTDRRYCIVFNGEIYNYRELKSELKDIYEFKTESDTEVLLAAYEIWGEGMFPRLRGMFAFGLWDTEKEELLLARDHMGIKPLYYALQHGVLSFSSEMPALIAGIENPTLNTESLAFYLSMEYVPGPQTLVKGIQKLKPGQLLRFKNGTCTFSSFLNEAKPVLKTISHDEVYSTIDTAVNRQLVSDRPIGAYLSGGFDSSIVVHHMVRHASKVKTFSVDFEAVVGQEDSADKFNKDARLAEQTALFYGTDHKTCTITLDAVRNTIEKASQMANEPIANSTAITQFLLSDFVRKNGVVVALGGDGGDELFGGYTRHRAAVSAYLYQKLPHRVQEVCGMFSPRIKKLATPFGTPLHMMLMAKDEKKIAPFLNQSLESNKYIHHYFDERYAEEHPNDLHPVETFMHVDRKTWLPDECFIRSDFASMAHGLELRVPIVDTDVVSLADQIPTWQKTFPYQGKRIIRKTYRPYLPAHLYNQPKRGWLSPAAKWFRDPVIKKLAHEVFSSSYYDGLSDVFNWEGTRNMLEAHIEQKGYYLYPLWNILVLQIWARENKIRIQK